MSHMVAVCILCSENDAPPAVFEIDEVQMFACMLEDLTGSVVVGMISSFARSSFRYHTVFGFKDTDQSRWTELSSMGSDCNMTWNPLR
jgi:hypothetical protein